MKLTWTPTEVIEEMKDGIKMFGEYTFNDKGPAEVMGIPDISKFLSSIPAEEVHEFLKALRGKTRSGSKREHVVSALLNDLQHCDWSEEEWNRICDASPGSF